MRLDSPRPGVSSAYRKPLTRRQRPVAEIGGVAYSEPARTAARRTYRSRRRLRPTVLGAVVAMILVAVPLLAAWHLLAGTAAQIEGKARTYLSPGEWPGRGQAAIVFGGGRPAVSPGEEPAPIASLAKVMTAYLTLERHPLGAGEEGFTMTVSAAQAAAVSAEAEEGQSVVAMRAGERLSERQLLEALLIPSGNNVARMLAVGVGGSEGDFVDEMNAQADALGMDDTTYTDPSGFDPGTVSTAADQLRVFRRAMRYPVFRQIVSMSSVTLPVAGTVANFNPLLDEGYAGKTGSDSAAGGCLAFFTRVTSGGHRQTAVGVVMGQGEGSDTGALLAAAGEAAERLVGFRPHIESPIRPGNAPPRKVAGVIHSEPAKESG
jgi:D-alanyl-D-alanine carboxypeptidase (penicillin-binding protein 5/6)